MKRDDLHSVGELVQRSDVDLDAGPPEMDAHEDMGFTEWVDKKAMSYVIGDACLIPKSRYRSAGGRDQIDEKG